MTQLVKFDRRNSSTRYNQGGGDRLTANADESLLGHCIEERGWTLERAIQNLKPISKHEAVHTTRAARVSKITAITGFVVGLVGGGTVGAIGMLPLAGAALATYVWQCAEACVPRRDLEYNLLKICPQIPEIMLACHRKGAASEVIVSAWDLLLDSYAESEGANAEQVVMEFARLLDHVGTVPDMGISDLESVQPERVPAIGFSTQFGEIAAQSTTAPDPVQNAPSYQATSQAAQSTQPAQAAQPSGPTLIGTLQRAYQSRAIYGGQRSGKSLAAAAASRQMAERGVNIFHINLASYRDENGHSEDDHYWTHAKRSVHADLSILSAFDALAKIAEAESILQEFYKTEFSVLIFDEVTLTGANFNQYSADLETLMSTLADKISTLGSTGEKRKRAIWTIAPDCVAGNLTQQTKIIKSLPGVYVAIAPGRTVTVNGGVYSFHAESFAAVQRNYPAMVAPAGSYGCDRIAFADGQWMPIGDLSFMFQDVPVKKPECPSVAAVEAMETASELTEAQRVLREAIAIKTMQRGNR